MATVKSFSAFLLIVSLSLFVISCDKTDIGHTDDAFYPEGYTCGFPYFIRQPGSELEFWWVETYDECLSAINLLKSHGSTFAPNAIFSYEGDLFDTKYCFIFNQPKDSIKFGENPFDRWAGNVEIKTYAFFEDVSIDELVYSYISQYDVLALNIIRYSDIDKTFDLDSVTFDRGAKSPTVRVRQNDKHIFSLTREKEKEEIDFSDDVAEAIINSMLFIGENLRPGAN